jgi:hypothetical protein
MSAFSLELVTPPRRSAAAARFIVWSGTLASLLDGLTTFVGLRHHNIGEANAFQVLVMQRYGLAGAVILRVLFGTAVFVLLAGLFGYARGWSRRMLFAIASLGVLVTTAFVVNNLDVLYLHHVLVPRSYVHLIYTLAERVIGT